VARRRCIGGTEAGTLCKRNADCPGSTCFDRNVFNLSVAVHFNADSTQIQVIKNALSGMSYVLMDVTDGQAEIGQFIIHNNAISSNNADIRIYEPGSGEWWWANTGGWKTGGSIHVSYNYIASSTHPGNVFVHEFTHLVFDARDEYQSATVGCTESLPQGTAQCPIEEAQNNGEYPCIMDNSNFSEYCWGQGALDGGVTHGNHDASLITEQSRCRSDRSVWDQVVWSWPNTFLKPAGAPDPGTNGATLNSPKFIEVDNTRRVVLALDRSGSMGTESPTRLSRLQTAARDFVALAENGTELGMVSFSTNGSTDVPLAALSADRTVYDTAINSLTASGATNIGEALQIAHSMIVNAGAPLPADTYIVLMSDGINNQSSPNLNSVLDDIEDDGIPVFVTCTGSDWNLSSQCTHIASATNGFSVDSADSSDLQNSFVLLHEKTRSADPVQTKTGIISSDGSTETFSVENKAESVTFTVTWKDTEQYVSMTVKDPNGVSSYEVSQMDQGLFVRIQQPLPGEWQVRIYSRISGEPYIAKAFVQNRVAQLGGAANKSVVRPGEAIKLFAYPQFYGSIKGKSGEIAAQVVRPDGQTGQVVFSDKGRSAGTGDDLPDDGQYTALYKDSKLPGAYTFIANLDSTGWTSNVEGSLSSSISPFKRELRITAVVDEVTSPPLSCREDRQASASGVHYSKLTCAEAVAAVEADLTAMPYREVCMNTYNLKKLPTAIRSTLLTNCYEDPNAPSDVYVDVDVCCPVHSKAMLPSYYLLLL
jgi:hypothetical protein